MHFKPDFSLVEVRKLLTSRTLKGLYRLQLEKQIQKINCSTSAKASLKMKGPLSLSKVALRI